MRYGRIIAPTESRRQMVQSFIEPVLEASAHQGLRRVQVLIPPSPPVALAIDHPDPLEAGPGRVFALPPAPPGQAIEFMLMPEQKLYAATAEGVGMALIGLIIEYLE